MSDLRGEAAAAQKRSSAKAACPGRLDAGSGEAKSLGAWNLTISGGEPTLYKQLPELIAYGKKQGYFIRLNSNGGLTDFGFAEALVDAGLDVADISLYSPVEVVHDAMRGAGGLWRKATQRFPSWPD